MDARINSRSEEEAVAIRAQLERVLASDNFASGDRQCRFLRYVVESTVDGNASQLNQFAVGIEVFDRDETFDPSTDAVVRVEAGRLRAKLAEYYSSAGVNDRVLIGLPKGGYVASIEFRPDLSSQNAETSSTRSVNNRLAIAALIASVIFASVYFGFFYNPASRSQLNETNASATFLNGGQPQTANSGTAVPPAIAILPFENMSDDSEQEYFSDGITEDIITDLSIVSGMTVIARHSTFVYKGRPVAIRNVGKDLGVRYVLEGSVRRSGNQIRITAQLIDAETESHIWAERYDRELEDVFTVQDDVTRKIVESLQVSLTEFENQNLGHRRTENLQAYDYLMRAQEQFYTFTPAGVAASIKLLQQSIELDPTYADAMAWKSRALVYAFVSGLENSEVDTIEPALDLARQAIKLDQSLAMAHASLAWALRWDSRNDDASSAIEVAIGLNPNFADAYLWKSMILSTDVRGDESIAAVRRGMHLNPNYGVTYIFALGRAHFVAGDYEIALQQFERGIIRNPSFVPNHIYKLFALERLGHAAELESARVSLELMNPAYQDSASYRFYVSELDSHPPR